MSDALPGVLTVADIDVDGLRRLVESRGMRLCVGHAGLPISGSYWGDTEAGLIGAHLHVRADTPVHSALHEASHFFCMSPQRQQSLDRDAGGDFDEENAVCYLQILLADHLPGVGRDRMMTDMDAWGYTFRLGSAARWFKEDAAEARHWLEQRGLLVQNDRSPEKDS